MEKLVILGSGIAGLTAAIYTARAEIEPLVISGSQPGGQLMLTTVVENFPGFPKGILGPELIKNCEEQAKKFGAKFKTAAAKSIKKVKNHFVIETDEEKIETAALIIATGASARWLNIPSEKKYKGRGVHTCATCDGFFYKDKEIIVVGGGDSAAEESSFLTKYAKKVTIVHRRESLKASKIMQERIKKNHKIDFMWNSEIQEFKGDDKKLKSVMIKNIKTGKVEEMPVDGVFLAIGHVPNTIVFKGSIDLDERGFIKTDNRTKTNVEGIFAAGDVQDPVFKQAVTAAGSGCQAAMEAQKYYAEWKHKNE